jgi:hypothetical protein
MSQLPRRRRPGVSLAWRQVLPSALAAMALAVPGVPRADAPIDWRARADQLVVAHSRRSLESDPALSLAWLRHLSPKANALVAWTHFLEATRRGVSWTVAPPGLPEIGFVTFAPGDRLAAVVAGGELFFWDLFRRKRSGAKLTEETHEEGCSCTTDQSATVTFSPGGGGRRRSGRAVGRGLPSGTRCSSRTHLRLAGRGLSCERSRFLP